MTTASPIKDKDEKTRGIQNTSVFFVKTVIRVKIRVDNRNIVKILFLVRLLIIIAIYYKYMNKLPDDKIMYLILQTSSCFPF